MSHPKTPPSLPQVVDEAGDTPLWVPALGLLLFCIAGLVIAVSSATREETTAEQGTEHSDAAAAAAGPDAARAP